MCTAGHGGFFCPEGSSSSTMEVCPAGFKCAPGSLKCDTADVETDGTCEACPEGQWCGEGTPTTEVHLCNPGFWCSSRTTEQEMHKHICDEGYTCAAGTTESDRLIMLAPEDAVPGGVFNNGFAYCPTGYYCPAGSYGNGSNSVESPGPRPCPGGSYSGNNTDATTNDMATEAQEHLRFSLSACAVSQASPQKNTRALPRQFLSLPNLLSSNKERVVALCS